MAAFYVGLGMLSFSVYPATGLPLLVAGLVLSLLVAPVEYLLGAISCAFLAASSTTSLAPDFLTLRWVLLGLAAPIVSLRFVLRRRIGGRRLPSRFGYLMVVFLVLSAATLMSTVNLQLTLWKLSALICLFYVASRAGAALVEAHGPASAHRLGIGLLAYTLPLIIASAPIYLFSARAGGESGQFGWDLGHPNARGTLLATLLPWAACPLFRRSPRLRAWRSALEMALLVLGYMLLQTGSRAGILGALSAVTFLCLVHADRRIAVALLLASVFIGARALARPEFLSSLSQQYLFKHKGQTELLQSRHRPWDEAKQKIRENRWLGLGFGVTSRAESAWSFDFRSGAMSETGSGYLGSLVQVGILGSSPLFMALAILLIRAGRFAWKVKDPWFTGAYGSMLALAVNSAFEGWLIAPGSFACVFFWMQCFLLNAVMCRFRSAPVSNVSFAAAGAAEGWARP